MTELFCPFCKKPVKRDYEATAGCENCAEDWRVNEQVDHQAQAGDDEQRAAGVFHGLFLLFVEIIHIN